MNTTTQNSPATAGTARLWSRGLSALVGVAAAVAIAVSSSTGSMDAAASLQEYATPSIAGVAIDPIQVASLESASKSSPPERIVVHPSRRSAIPAYDAIARAELQADVRNAMRASRDQLAFEISSLMH